MRCFCNKLIMFVLIMIILSFNSSCILPYKITEGIDVYAVCDYLHCGIVTHTKVSETINRYTHYTFVDIEWYVNGNMGFCELFSALFLDAPSALEVGVYEGEKELDEIINGLFYAQTPDGWKFPVPEESFQKGIDYINNDIIGNNGKYIKTIHSSNFEFNYYETEQTYNMFYNCMNFTAYVLQEMGVDIGASWYVYTNPIIRNRLNCLTSMITF